MSSSNSNYRPPVMHFQGRHNHNSGPTGSRGGGSAAPRGYIPGIGRGAAGFTTRSDIGPMAAPAGGAGGASAGGAGGGGDVGAHLSGSGSRSAELREAKIRMKQMQQGAGAGPGPGPGPGTGLKTAPVGYVAGLGRGAGFKGGGDGDQGGPARAGGGGGEGGGTYDQFDGYVNDRLFGDTPYDDEDEEADKIYAAIDERMSSKGASVASKKKRRKLLGSQDGDGADAADGAGAGGSRIGDQFRELKEKLADVTEEQWMALPDVGDYSLPRTAKTKLNPVGDFALALAFFAASFLHFVI